MTDLDAGDVFETWMDAREREPVTRAEALGHDMEWDPPAAMTATDRWTCTVCGEAVLRNGRVIYGGAVKRKCGADDARH